MNWYPDGRGFMGGGNWMDGGGFIFMAVMWLLIFAVGIWVVMRLTHKEGKAAPQSLSSPGQETPRQILDRRLASGEIDAEAYAQARKLIEGS